MVQIISETVLLGTQKNSLFLYVTYVTIKLHYGFKICMLLNYSIGL